jgi:hypothetical protein
VDERRLIRHDAAVDGTGWCPSPGSNIRITIPITAITTLILLAGQSSASTYYG